MTSLSIALSRLPLLPSFNFTYYVHQRYHIFSLERNPYTASSNVWHIFMCNFHGHSISCFKCSPSEKEKEKEKKSYVSHKVITVSELMQNEVNETITAVLDCNL